VSAKNFIVRGGGDFSGIKRELDKTQKQLASFKAGVSKTVGRVAMILGTIGFGHLVKESTKYAMGVETNIGNINRNLGSNALEYKKWIDANGTQLGIATADAFKYGSTFSNMITGFAKDNKQATDLTIDTMKAASIISSKTGRTFDDTANRIRSGMLGSTEAIEDLGVYTQVSMLESTEAFRRFAGDKSWAQLDFQVQQQIRLAAILEQAYDKYGTTLTDNTQTRHNQFIASLNNVKLSLGNAFLPIYNAVLPALTRMASAIGRVMNIIAQFVTALFGSATPFKATSDGFEETAGSAGDLADNIGGAGKAAKKAAKDAKGALAGFDQLNILAKPAADTGSGGGGGGSVGGFEMPKTDTGEGLIGGIVEVSEKVKQVAEEIKNAFNGIKDSLKKNDTTIISSLSGIGAAIGTYFAVSKWGAISKGVSGAFTAIGTAMSTISIPVLIVAGLIGLVVGTLVNLWRTSDEFREAVINAWNGIKDTLQNIYETVLKPIFDAFVAMLKDIYENGIKPLWDKWKEFIKEIVLLLTDLWNGMKPVVDWIVDTFGPVIVGIFKGVFTAIGNTVKAILNIVGSLIDGFKGTVQGIRLIFSGIIDFLVGVFTADWSRAWDGIGKIFGGLKNIVGSIWENIKNVFVTILTWIGTNFMTKWTTIWNAVSSIFEKIWDGFKDLVRAPVNYIIDALNKLINGVNKFKINIPDWVATLAGIPKGGTIGFNIPTIPKLAQGGYVGANNPILAMIGDNTREGEIVAPESKIYEQVLKALQNVSQGGNTILEIDGVTFGRVVANSINKANRYAGTQLLEV